MENKSLYLGILKNEIDIVCTPKHTSSIVNDTLVIKFSSNVGATRAYNKSIYSRYFGLI